MYRKELIGLGHLPGSLRKLPCHAKITPATCRRYGPVSHDDRLHKPGKCPVCRGIGAPLIRIEAGQ